MRDELRAHGLHDGATVLDLGAGSQPLRQWIEGEGGRYTPCDIGDGPHVPMVAGRELDLPERAFDLCLSMQVLEHVWDLDEYLGHARRHLGPNGRLVLSTHGVWLYHPHPTDFRRWTRDGLARELESRGFELLHMTAILGPLAWSTQIRAMGFAYVLFRGGRLGEILAGFVSALMNARMIVEDAVTPESIRLANACVYVAVAKVARTRPDAALRE